jgi:DNA sulfur modification protein DndB
MSKEDPYVWPALAGKVGTTEFFVAMCTARFVVEVPTLPEEAQYRRTQLDPGMAARLVAALKGKGGTQSAGVFVVSVVGKIRFKPAQRSQPNVLGWIEVPAQTRILLCDGFQRQAALRAFISRNPGRAIDSVPVVFYSDPDGRNYGNLFQALHLSARKGTRSRRVMADAGDPVARIIRELLKRVPEFGGLVEMNKANVAPRSSALFTVSALFQATRVLLQPLRNQPGREQLTVALTFWRKLFEVFDDWRRVHAGSVSAGEIRQRYIHSHGVVLDAVAQVAAQLVQQHPEDWVIKLDALGDIDWSRENPLWEGRALLGGRVSKARQNVVLTVTALKTALGLSVSEAERQSEAALQRSKRNES